MDSGLLTSSYERYKADTNTFVTWVSERATACGYIQNPRYASYSPAPAPAPAPDTELPHSVHVTLGEKLREKAAKKAVKRETRKMPTPGTPPATSVRHKVITSTKELLVQAKAVALNGEVKMPARLVRVLQRAIDARKRFFLFFQATQPKNRDSNDAHLHFIGILEQSLEILEPSLEILEPCIQRDGSETSDQTRQDPQSFSFANRFQNLSVDVAEEVEKIEDFDNVNDVEVAEDMETSENSSRLTTPANSFDPNPADPTSEAESDCDLEILDDLYERLFAAYCFFEDTHRILEFIKGIWEEYKNGKCDLITVSFITNAAIDIVKTEEAKILESVFPEHKAGYWELVNCLFISILQPPDYGSLTLDERNEYRARIHVGFVPTPYDAFFYRWTARYQLKNHEDWCERFLPFYPLITRDFDVAKVDLLEFPEWREIVADDVFISEMMSEILLGQSWEGMKNELEYGRLSPAFIPDRFVEEVRELGAHNRGEPRLEMTTSLIFASQVLLDVHHILGERTEESCNELTTLMNNTEAAFRMEFSHDVGLRGAQNSFFHCEGESYNPKNAAPFLRMALRRNIGATYWFDERKKMMMMAFKLIPHDQSGLDWAKYGTPPEKREEFLDEWSKTRLNDSTVMQMPTRTEVIYAEADAEAGAETSVEAGTPEDKESPDPTILKHYNIASSAPFFFSHNPSNCGTRMLEYSLDAEEAATSITNHHWSIFLVSHLYNAAKQIGILTKSWPEMDRMIDLHLEALFSGQLPSTPEQIQSRFSVAFGVKPSEAKNFQRTKVQSKSSKFNKHGYEQGPKALLQCTKTSKILAKLRDENDPITLQQCLYQINALIEEASSKSKGKTTRKRDQPQLTYVELLARFRQWFPKVVQDMQIDYVSLNRVCNTILWRIRLTVLVELNIKHSVAFKPADKHAEPGFPLMVWRILENVQHRKKKGAGGRGGKDFSAKGMDEDPQMLVGGKVLRKFLGEEVEKVDEKAEKTEESSESAANQ